MVLYILPYDKSENARENDINVYALHTSTIPHDVHSLTLHHNSCLYALWKKADCVLGMYRNYSLQARHILTFAIIKIRNQLNKTCLR